MKKAITLVVFLTLAINLSAQLDTIIKYPMQDSTSSNVASLILSTSDSKLIYFTHESDSIYLSRSTDGGVTWLGKKSIFQASPVESSDLAGIVTEKGKIIIAYKKENSLTFYIRSSLDDGESWSESGTVASGAVTHPNFKETMDGKLWLLFTQSGQLKYRTSENNGDSWGVPRSMWYYVNGGDLVSINDTTLLLVAAPKHDTREDYELFGNFSYDNGKTWEQSFEIITSEEDDSRPKLVRKTNGEIELVFQRNKLTSSDPFYFSRVMTAKSTDGGQTWSDPALFTSYSGTNDNHNISLVDDKTYITFSSDRFNARQIWYGIKDISQEIITPPIVLWLGIYPTRPLSEEPVTFKASLLSNNPIENVTLFHSVNGVDMEPMELFDDGLHSDGSENDGDYGNTTDGYHLSDTVEYYVTATDDQSYTTMSNRNAITYPPSMIIKNCLIDINNIYLPISNDGITADVLTLFPNNELQKSGYFDGHSFLYSGGFGLSGYTNGNLWGNGMMSASRVEDYLPGNINSDHDSSDFSLYLLKSTTAPFSSSWMDWKKAVELGANFYDGDNDGIYNPVDLNANGEWDVNEDAPDLLGDQTAWCMYNDGVPAETRGYLGVQPQGIEIRQSVFAYDKNKYPELANVIFIRYKIENSGSITPLLDSVYFSSWTDTDLGDYFDDLTGCDTTLASGYVYNNGDDIYYGANAPAFFTTLLEGPASYIPGITYVDVNSNEFYDDGVDTVLDTAYANHGVLLGMEKFPGATNQPLRTHIEYLKSHPTQGDADDEEQLRNYMLGRNQEGEFIDPCDWDFGIVENEDCSTVNPRFMYSGDPVNRKGWFSSVGNDKRNTISTGPFQLEVDKPIEILIAYTVGRGTDALNSITVGKEIVKDVIRFYETNFSDYSVRIKNNRQVHTPTEFRLSQNYPNPFNPVTTIEFSIPQEVKSEKSKVKNWGDAIVQLKIYDILGREVATLVNKPQAPGNYKVSFNASSLASGVYFYRLKYGAMIQSKKMVLLK